MNIELRPYQIDGLNAIWNYFQDGNTGNPLLCWPTGTGKSIAPAIFIRETLRLWPNQRFMLLTHVGELLRQNAKILKLVWEDAPLGLHSAGLKLRDTAHPIIYAGIQSAVRKGAPLFGWRDIIFIDEAHLISTNESSMYLTFLATMKLINPNLKVIGMTATPYRMGSGMLTDQGGIFTDIVHDLTSMEGFNELLNAGFMVPLIPLRTKTELDVSDVGVQQGEFVQTQLQGAIDKAEITYNALKELVHAGQNRKSWLIFASGIEHAEHIAEQLGAFGVECAPVHSKRPTEYNDAAIGAFKSNQLRAIVNYGKLTTGFDYPPIDLIGMLRPTLSVPLWVQMLGRGTRPAYEKQNCIAQGSLVLTNNGLIPIEKITLNDKVWDGENFVFHTGVIYQGFKEVINYHGLVATMDHKVYTKKGWQTFGECSKKRIAIKITGIGRNPIRETENLFSTNHSKKEIIYTHSMYKMLSHSIQRIYKRDKLQSWLPNMWKFFNLAASSKMVTSAMRDGKRSLLQSKQQTLFGLWWTWNKVQFSNSYAYGNLCHANIRFGQKQAYRPQRQQWSLRNWKFKIFNTFRKYAQQKNRKEHVFDITNAGKHNRFTVNGLLVSNCLVLDFARNTPRLGPINDPAIPKMKKGMPGEMPVKICEACGAYNHTKVRFCVNCGEEFSFQQKLVSTPGTEELIRGAVTEPVPIIEQFNVLGAHYEKYITSTGKPSIKATYFTPGLPFREYVLLEHSGMAGKVARDWWRRRHRSDPPATVDAAILKISELKCPRFIRVHVNKKHPEILGVEF